jgi:hypothetical protein
MGQRSLKRKVAWSRLRINGSGFGNSRMEGILTAPQTPMDGEFADIESDDEEGSPSQSGVFENHPQHPEHRTPPYDFEVSPPPTPPSLSTVYAQSSEFDFDFSPLLPAIPTTKQSRAALSSALTFSRPSSILHHSLHRDTSSIAGLQDFHESPPDPPVSRVQQLKPAKRLPRPHQNSQRSQAESSPIPPPSTSSSPFSLSFYQFPHPPALKDQLRHSSDITSPSIQTESYSDLLHLYGVSFEMLNRHNSFNSTKTFCTTSAESMAGDETNSTVRGMISDYANMSPSGGVPVTQRSAGVAPSAPPPGLPTNLPRPAPLFSNQDSMDPTSHEVNTDELLGSVEFSRAAPFYSPTDHGYTNFPSSPTGRYVASLPDEEPLPTPEANRERALSFLEGRSSRSSSVNRSPSPDGPRPTGVINTPSPLRHKAGMIFRNGELVNRDVSYHSPVDHPPHLLSSEPNDEIEGDRPDSIMTTISGTIMASRTRQEQPMPMSPPKRAKLNSPLGKFVESAESQMSDIIRGKQPLRAAQAAHRDPTHSFHRPRRSSYTAAVAKQTQPIELVLLKLNGNQAQKPEKSRHWPGSSERRLEAARQARQQATADRHERRLRLLKPYVPSFAASSTAGRSTRAGSASTHRPLLSLPSGSLMPLPKIPEPLLRQPIVAEDNPRLMEAGLNREENWPIVQRQRRLSRWILAVCVTNPITNLLYYMDQADVCIKWLTKGEIKNVNEDYWRYSRHGLWVWGGIIVTVLVIITIALTLHYRH